jgi:hypothetical protein
VATSTKSTTRSQQIIADMMAANPNVKRTGFAKAMREAFDWPEIGEIAGTIIPDGYHISHERREVTILEVDDTHPINELKASRIGDLADAMLEEEWDLVVIVVDYAGNITAAVPGWCYLHAYTKPLTPPGCRDFTPAAIAVHRKIANRPKQ